MKRAKSGMNSAMVLSKVTVLDLGLSCRLYGIILVFLIVVLDLIFSVVI